MNTLFRRTATLIAGLGLAAGVGISAASTASADPHTSCTAGRVCIYWGLSLTGPMLAFDSAQNDHRKFQFPNGERFANNAVSVRNRTWYHVVISSETYNYGAHFDIAPQQSASRIGDVTNANMSHLIQ